jgi:hypothetical protein
MVGQARVSVAYQHERTFDMASLRRLAVWGGAATLALLLAVLASYSDANSRRLMAADAQKAGAPDAQLPPRPPEIDAQTQRLAAAVDGLTADRERLTARIGTIERNLEDVTGAIKRQAAEPGGATSAALPAPVAKEVAQEKQEAKQEIAKEVTGGTMAPPLNILAARQPAATEAQPVHPEALASLPAIRPRSSSASVSAARSISTACGCCGPRPRATTRRCSKAFTRWSRCARTTGRKTPSCGSSSGRWPMSRAPPACAQTFRRRAATASRSRSRGSACPIPTRYPNVELCRLRPNRRSQRRHRRRRSPADYSRDSDQSSSRQTGPIFFPITDC